MFCDVAAAAEAIGVGVVDVEGKKGCFAPGVFGVFAVAAFVQLKGNPLTVFRKLEEGVESILLREFYRLPEGVVIEVVMERGRLMIYEAAI